MAKSHLFLQFSRFGGLKSKIFLEIYLENGYRICVDIMTGGNYRQFRLLTRTSFIVQFVYTVGGEVSYEFHLNDNLV